MFCFDCQNGLKRVLIFISPRNYATLTRKLINSKSSTVESFQNTLGFIMVHLFIFLRIPSSFYINVKSCIHKTRCHINVVNYVSYFCDRNEMDTDQKMKLIVLTMTTKNVSILINQSTIYFSLRCHVLSSQNN